MTAPTMTELELRYVPRYAAQIEQLTALGAAAYITEDGIVTLRAKDPTPATEDGHFEVLFGHNDESGIGDNYDQDDPRRWWWHGDVVVSVGKYEHDCTVWARAIGSSPAHIYPALITSARTHHTAGAPILTSRVCDPDPATTWELTLTTADGDQHSTHPTHKAVKQALYAHLNDRGIPADRPGDVYDHYTGHPTDRFIAVEYTTTA